MENDVVWDVLSKVRKEATRFTPADIMADMIKYACHLYILSYPLRIGRKWTEPLWDLFDPYDCTDLIFEINNRKQVLMGWALVPRKSAGYHLLQYQQTFLEILEDNWTLLFYDELNALIPDLVVHAQVCDDGNAPKQALEDTQRRWGSRDFAKIGWTTPSSLTLPLMNEQGIDVLVNVLISAHNWIRNFTLVYLQTVFQLDFPVLEAISWSWPGEKVKRKYNSWSIFTLAWPNRQARLVGRQEYDTIFVGPYELELECSDTSVWAHERQTWPRIFASFGIQVKGSVLGIIV